MTRWAKTPGRRRWTACNVAADGELWECVRRCHWRQSWHPESERLALRDPPFPAGYITNREELEEASNELFSLIASGVIKVDVADAQKYPLTDAQRAHEVLESRATQGSSLLIP